MWKKVKRNYMKNKVKMVVKRLMLVDRCNVPGSVPWIKEEKYVNWGRRQYEEATRTGVGIAATVREDKTKERKELMAEQSPTLTRHSDALRVFRPTPTLYLLILQPQPTLQQQPSFTSPWTLLLHGNVLL